MKKLSLILILCIFSCKPKDCFDTVEQQRPEYISLEKFSEIEAGQNFSVTLIQDTTREHFIQMQSSGGKYDGITYRIEDGILKLHDAKTCDWSRSYEERLEVLINVPGLREARLYGDASLFCRDTIRLHDQDTEFKIRHQSTNTAEWKLQTFRLVTDHYGLGTMKLVGYAAILTPNMYDGGKLDATALQGDYIFVYHYGINDCLVKPYKILEVNRYNRGNTCYYADPVEGPVKVMGTGSGSVVRKY